MSFKDLRMIYHIWKSFVATVQKLGCYTDTGGYPERVDQGTHFTPVLNLWCYFNTSIGVITTPVHACYSVVINP